MHKDDLKDVATAFGLQKGIIAELLGYCQSIWKHILNLPLIHALLNFFQFNALTFIGYKPPVVLYMVHHLPCQSSHPQAHMPIQICPNSHILPPNFPNSHISPPTCCHIPTLMYITVGNKTICMFGSFELCIQYVFLFNG